jgi:hypothetical protein
VSLARERVLIELLHSCNVTDSDPSVTEYVTLQFLHMHGELGLIFTFHRYTRCTEFRRRLHGF